MILKRITFSLFVLCTFVLITSCEKQKTCTDELSEKDINVIYYYNAYFDFFNSIDALDFEVLKTENMLIDKGANTEYGIRYEINLPVGYEDASRNKLSGKINYSSKHDVANSAGNEIAIEFEGVVFNEIGVGGGKNMEFASENDVHWCAKNKINFRLDTESIELEGCLSKAWSNDNMTISGTNILTVNDVEYQIDITEPVVKNDNCNWFTSGELTITERTKRILRFENECLDVRMTLSNEEGCKSIDLEEKHNLW